MKTLFENRPSVQAVLSFGAMAVRYELSLLTEPRPEVCEPRIRQQPVASNYDKPNEPAAKQRSRRRDVHRLSPFFSPLVTARAIPGTTARCPITERGAVSAESRYNSGNGEKVVVAKPVSPSSA